MTTDFLTGFLNLFNRPLPSQTERADQAPGHGRLIVCQKHFLNTFQSLDKKQLRNLIKAYEGVSCDTILAHEMLEFLSILMRLDETSKAGQRTIFLLDNVLRALLHLRNTQKQRFSLRVLHEQLILHDLIKLSKNNDLPKTLRSNLVNYLDILPDYANTQLFDEPPTVRALTTHYATIQSVLGIINCLVKPSLDWLKGMVEQAAVLHRGGKEDQLQAYELIRQVFAVNHRYNLMAADDIGMQLHVRGCRYDPNHPALHTQEQR